MKRVVAILMCGCLLASVADMSAAAGAASPEDVRKTAEATMLVTGIIDVDPSGSLHSYALDQPEKLPPAVVGVVGKALSSWAFKLSEPTDELVHSKVSLRVVAKPMADGNYKVTVEGASFFQPGPGGEWATIKDRSRQPRYPTEAVDARVSGTAYLLLRIGRDGTVEEAFAEQVNLDQYSSEVDMKHYRKLLADAALDAARHWTYTPPSNGAHVDDPFWLVRSPVVFHIKVIGTPTAEQPYGHWKTYIPGPRQELPWIGKSLANESPDAMPEDEMRSGDPRLQLITPVGGA
ncbi:energy transducer TonB [Dyella sp. C9]|uniref:energy transducer TonB n=1 Tax=Dyella sp. C9 TaxID=2202154 RepID=UPI000DEEF461|nr:energy transducer TonB [Dyella sp. C9]